MKKIVTIKNRSKRYRVDRKNMIQECKNPIVKDDFHGFLHRNCEGTEQLQRIKIITGLLFALILLLAGMILSLLKKQDTPLESRETEKQSTQWSADSLKKGRVTAIDYSGQVYAYIGSKKDAGKEIAEYGMKQREKYDNPGVKEIEKQMEDEFGIFAINLGEMDEETAKDVKRAFSYMYETYPCLQGTLTNVTLGNPDNYADGNIAITECREFVINGELAVCPFVVKHEIVLYAPSFLQRNTLLKKCKDGAKQGYWPKNMDISAIVVHELGHQLLNVHIMEEFNFDNIYYITEKNRDEYYLYLKRKKLLIFPFQRPIFLKWFLQTKIHLPRWEQKEVLQTWNKTV